MKNTIFLLPAIAAAIISGCAKDTTASPNEMTKEYIEAWLNKNYPNAVKSGNGIYILKDTPGTGEPYNFEQYAIVKTTVSNLSGDIKSTTDKQLSMQLGKYNSSYYYGPKTWKVSKNYQPVGIYDMIGGMKRGGYRKALIPSWLMGYKRYKNPAKYIKNSPDNAVTSIYEISLEDFTNDIDKLQISQIEEFIAKKKMAGAKPIEKGFYYKQIKSPKAKIDKDTIIYINYIGRLLNGQVFDTNIKDTAKVYNIYNPRKQYKPIAVDRTEKTDKIKFKDAKGGLIRGFQMLIKKMGTYEKAAGIFISDYGYKEQSVANTIPGYSPLCFEVELTEKPSEE